MKDVAMNNSLLVDNLARGVRSIGSSCPSDLESAVEGYLDRELGALPQAERLHLLESLAERFDRPEPVVVATTMGSQATTQASADVTRLISLFLGKAIGTTEIGSDEISGKFAQSLNTLFDTLNEIISVINVTLLGQHPELATIRKVIGSNLEEGAGGASLKDYLDQIKQAFQVAHQSYQVAATAVLDELLTELDPESLAQAKSSGLKFGPLRKAELFEMYEERHARCRRWFSSGQLTERLLRDFEKQCQQTFKSPMR